ncbi:MAG: amidohydrolase [Alphaproteobacteria bacterium]|nr:amidohydrolase [Alphaproteobacteria bacterium]
MKPAQKTALAWVAANHSRLSKWHKTIWDFAEPSWREYKSAAWYVDVLKREGFKVEAGSAGMPTAFCATWGKGGPTLGAYAEYDAVPGTSQAAVPRRKPREGLHKWAAGHTDPHSALGLGALGGMLAAKHAMARHGIKGRIKFFGEPAEKMCGSKPVHAAHGYYDDLDAAISFHPTSLPALANTCLLDTHCGAYWSAIYSFECESPESWVGALAREGTQNSHSVSRAPGANDALCLMYTTTKYTKESMLPHHGSWTLNEAILVGGQATADNLAPNIAQIQYACRAPTLDMMEKVFGILDQNAEQVAKITHCTVTRHWVTKTRPGLPNRALADITYRNLEMVGPPQFPEKAKVFARRIQKNLGMRPMANPFMPEVSRLTTPEKAEAALRASLPPWQKNYTSDDYVEYTWHAPTVRLYVGRAMLRPPKPGYRYPDWPRNALGGYPPAIDPLWETAARCVGATLIDLFTDPEGLKRCRDEFKERTGGGIGGKTWLPPLLPRRFKAPVHFRWPEYVTTVRGEEWWIPTESA